MTIALIVAASVFASGGFFVSGCGVLFDNWIMVRIGGVIITASPVCAYIAGTMAGAQ